MKPFAFLKGIPALLLLIIFSDVSRGQDNFPGWAEGIVWYQIFPERFANGDTLNDPKADKVFLKEQRKPDNWKINKWTGNWFEMSDWEKQLGGNVRDHMFQRRYGGDLQGIIDHLDYLKDLGIGAIYLNPVFESVSLHKYDATIYHHIDRDFGPAREFNTQNEKLEDASTWLWSPADSLFLKLVEEVHNRGMKIIIDGVFNHVGTEFPAFKDIKEKGKESKYYNWFMVTNDDDPSTPEDELDYKGWWNNRSMPEFNRDKKDLNAGPKQYIFTITQRWMDPNKDGDPSDGIDGWRLDVARDVPLGFWKDWSKLVKHLNMNAIIIGELWELSPDFISDEGIFDALMNYNFAFAINDFFIADKTKIKAEDFIDRLKEIDETYPEKYLTLLQNLIDSHDTDRLSSLIANPDRRFDRDGNEGNKKYNPGKPSKDDYEKQKLIAAFQMTYRGAPMIYYGTEAGMWGADDPHDRKPMVWDELKYDDEVITPASGFKRGFGIYKVEQNKDLLEYYKKVIAIRNSNSALKKGDLKFLYSNSKKSSFAFRRVNENNVIVAAFNIGSKEDKFELNIGSGSYTFEELLTGERGSSTGGKGEKAFLNVELPPNSVKIFSVYRQESQN